MTVVSTLAAMMMNFDSRVAVADEPVQRADARDGERARPAEARARGRHRLGDEVKAGLGLEEVDELRDEFQPLLARELFDVGEARLEGDAAVARLKDDLVVGARLDAAARVERDGEVDGGRAGVEEVERPDVDGAPGQVYPRRGGCFDDHEFVNE